MQACREHRLRTDEYTEKKSNSQKHHRAAVLR
jgi:hypothetical protein